MTRGLLARRWLDVIPQYIKPDSVVALGAVAAYAISDPALK